MQYFPALPLCRAVCLVLTIVRGNALAQEIVATSADAPVSTDSQTHQVEQIRKMVLGLGYKKSTPAQLVQLARGLEPAAASNLFLEIADDYLHTGHCNLATDVLLQLMEKFPDEPTTTEATLRLIRLYSSSELAHAKRQIPDTVQQLHLPPGWRKQSTDAEKANASTSRSSGMLEYALNFANGQLQRHPELAKNSTFAFQCATTARLSGRSQESRSWLTLLKHKRESAHWRTRALVETWLADFRDHEAPLPITRCVPADKPPHLDGILNETLWLTADSFMPHSELDDLKSEVLFAYDSEFCYVAVRCQRIAGDRRLADSLPRTYDADLEGYDHVVLRLDADRDYATCFRLAVDHRGQTADACWRDASWNPEWFVAAGGHTWTWTIEAAIAWSELVAAAPRAGDAWAVCAHRVAPTQQAESPPEGFRLLIFD